MSTKMNTTFYHEIAGRSIERLAALSDGIFSVAMTLLVLDLHVPATGNIHSERELWQALIAIAPNFGVFAMSLLTLGIFWVGQQTQFNYCHKGDRIFTWIHIVFLFAVLTMPFSTKLLAVFITYRLAFVIYWVNIFILGTLVYVSWNYAAKHELTKTDLLKDISTAIKRRIIMAQSLYALGALLCLVNIYWSLGFILLVQLNYAISPRFSRCLG